MEDPQRTSTSSAPWRGIWQWLSELKMHLPENSILRNLPSGTLALWESYVDKDIHSSRRLEPLKRSPTGANGLSDGHRNLLSVLCPCPSLTLSSLSGLLPALAGTQHVAPPPSLQISRVLFLHFRGWRLLTPECAAFLCPHLSAGCSPTNNVAGRTECHFCRQGLKGPHLPFGLFLSWLTCARSSKPPCSEQSRGEAHTVDKEQRLSAKAREAATPMKVSLTRALQPGRGDRAQATVCDLLRPGARVSNPAALRSLSTETVRWEIGLFSG